MRIGFRSWLREEDAALTRQFRGKTVNSRFNGLRRSERNEAKLFLIAMAPVLLVSLVSPKWADASFAQKVAMATADVWMVGVLGVGTFFIFRALIRISKSRND